MTFSGCMHILKATYICVIWSFLLVRRSFNIFWDHRDDRNTDWVLKVSAKDIILFFVTYCCVVTANLFKFQEAEIVQMISTTRSWDEKCPRSILRPTDWQHDSCKPALSLLPFSYVILKCWCMSVQEGS